MKEEMDIQEILGATDIIEEGGMKGKHGGGMKGKHGGGLTGEPWRRNEEDWKGNGEEEGGKDPYVTFDWTKSEIQNKNP